MDKVEDIKKALTFDIDSMLDEVFSEKEVQDKAILFNQEQLLDGKDALAQDIKTFGGSPYRPYTAKIRDKAGLPTDKVTLYFTGEFHESFRLDIVKDGYEIIGDLEKEDGNILDNIPGEFDIFGLDKSSLTELVREDIIPRLSKKIRDALF